MSTKTLQLYSFNEDELYTYIGVTINDNGTFKNTNKIIQRIDVKRYLVNNLKRRGRYKLNKEKNSKIEEQREEQRLIDEEKVKELEHSKQLEKDKIRYESMTEEIDMNNELEDMESYI